MSTEIKAYLSNTQDENSLCFHTTVYSQKYYDVHFDLNETYEVLLDEALKGKLEFDFINKNNLSKDTFKINNNNDYKKNLDLFVELLENFYGLTIVSEHSEFCQHFGVRLEGAGFRYEKDIPMLETSQFNARNSIHSIKTQLFPANNIDNIYLKAASGSLKLTLESTNRYDEPISFIKSIYEDIENGNIDHTKYDNDRDKQYRYQTIVKNLSDLSNQKKLEKFFIIIDGKEEEIKNRKYLSKIIKDIYKEHIEITGIFEAYKPRTESFEIYSSDMGKFYCHLKSLARNDYNEFQNIISILKTKNGFDKCKIKIYGEKIKPQTINVNKIELVN